MERIDIHYPSDTSQVSPRWAKTTARAIAFNPHLHAHLSSQRIHGDRESKSFPIQLSGFCKIPNLTTFAAKKHTESGRFR